MRLESWDLRSYTWPQGSETSPSEGKLSVTGAAAIGSWWWLPQKRQHPKGDPTGRLSNKTRINTNGCRNQWLTPDKTHNSRMSKYQMPFYLPVYHLPAFLLLLHSTTPSKDLHQSHGTYIVPRNQMRSWLTQSLPQHHEVVTPEWWKRVWMIMLS